MVKNKTQKQIIKDEAVEKQVAEVDAYAHISHNKKRAMLNALVRTLGVVTTACKAVGIHRRTHYDWIAADPEYKACVREIENVAIDMAESQLHRKILDGDTIATIFFLKTKGKKRGYVERTEVTGRDGEPLRAFSWDELFDAARKNREE